MIKKLELQYSIWQQVIIQETYFYLYYAFIYLSNIFSFLDSMYLQARCHGHPSLIEVVFTTTTIFLKSEATSYSNWHLFCWGA